MRRKRSLVVVCAATAVLVSSVAPAVASVPSAGRALSGATLTNEQEDLIGQDGQVLYNIEMENSNTENLTMQLYPAVPDPGTGAPAARHCLTGAEINTLEVPNPSKLSPPPTPPPPAPLTGSMTALQGYWVSLALQFQNGTDRFGSCAPAGQPLCHASDGFRFDYFMYIYKGSISQSQMSSSNSDYNLNDLASTHFEMLGGCGLQARKPGRDQPPGGGTLAAAGNAACRRNAERAWYGEQAAAVQSQAQTDISKAKTEKAKLKKQIASIKEQLAIGTLTPQVADGWITATTAKLAQQQGKITAARTKLSELAAKADCVTDAEDEYWSYYHPCAIDTNGISATINGSSTTPAVPAYLSTTVGLNAAEFDCFWAKSTKQSKDLVKPTPVQGTSSWPSSQPWFTPTKFIYTDKSSKYNNYALNVYMDNGSSMSVPSGACIDNSPVMGCLFMSLQSTLGEPALPAGAGRVRHLTATKPPLDSGVGQLQLMFDEPLYKGESEYSITQYNATCTYVATADASGPDSGPGATYIGQTFKASATKSPITFTESTFETLPSGVPPPPGQPPYTVPGLVRGIYDCYVTPQMNKAVAGAAQSNTIRVNYTGYPDAPVLKTTTSTKTACPNGGGGTYCLVVSWYPPDTMPSKSDSVPLGAYWSANGANLFEYNIQCTQFNPQTGTVSNPAIYQVTQLASSPTIAYIPATVDGWFNCGVQAVANSGISTYGMTGANGLPQAVQSATGVTSTKSAPMPKMGKRSTQRVIKAPRVPSNPLKAFRSKPQSGKSRIFFDKRSKRVVTAQVFTLGSLKKSIARAKHVDHMLTYSAGVTDGTRWWGTPQYVRALPKTIAGKKLVVLTSSFSKRDSKSICRVKGSLLVHHYPYQSFFAGQRYVLAPVINQRFRGC